MWKARRENIHLQFADSENCIKDSKSKREGSGHKKLN